MAVLSHALANVPGCVQCEHDEVGCVGRHHGAACLHPTCTDCGHLLEDRSDTCMNCGREEAG